MRTSSILASLSAIVAFASAYRREDYKGIHLQWEFRSNEGTPYWEQSRVEINKLTPVAATQVYSVNIDKIATGVDVDRVTCRAYANQEGTRPVASWFTRHNPLVLTTEGKGYDIATVLCYMRGPNAMQ
jgi:hypothetical protein